MGALQYVQVGLRVTDHVMHVYIKYKKMPNQHQRNKDSFYFNIRHTNSEIE